MSKNRSRWCRALTAAVVAATPFVVAALVAPRGRATITREGFDRLVPGMTRAEVEGVLGAPGQGGADGYLGRYKIAAVQTRRPDQLPAGAAGLALPRGVILAWPGRGPRAIVVEFDAGGRAAVLLYLEGQADPPVWERLVPWLMR
jgi:hypothetical protein